MGRKKAAVKRPARDAPSARAERFRERIQEFRRVRCGDIEPHPQNPRMHPGHQLAAVSGLLTEVGKAAPLLAFPADGLGPKGDFSQLMYYDGHGRQVIDPDEVWWIAVTDLTRAEADKMVLAGDATGALASYDPARFYGLMGSVQTATQEVADMLTGLWEATKVEPQPDAFEADADNLESEYMQGKEKEAKTTTVQFRLVCDASDSEAIIELFRRSIDHYENAKLYAVV